MLFRFSKKRLYATISAIPPSTVSSLHEQVHVTTMDACVLDALHKRSAPGLTLPDIIQQFENCTGHILDISLPYESRPSHSRRPSLDPRIPNDNVVMVAHCVANAAGIHKVTLSSGFALEISGQRDLIVVTCAHTLEEAWNY